MASESEYFGIHIEPETFFELERKQRETENFSLITKVLEAYLKTGH